MKKNILFSLILLGTLFEPVYAFSISSDTQLISNVVAIGLVFFGLIIVLVGKISGGNKDIYVEKEKNLISGLTDEEKLDEVKSFNPDSIFKVLPTFSSKKFEENIKNVLTNYYSGKLDDIEKSMNKDLLSKYELLESFKITDFNIIDFIEDDDKYTIKSLVKTESGTKKTKVENMVTVTSVNKKVKHDNVRCPVCGGKIKDLTKLRCTFCGTILPNNTELNNDQWIIEEIDKK